MTVAVVGAGAIAREYVRVLRALGHTPVVVGRSGAGIERFKAACPGVPAEPGGIEAWLDRSPPPDRAIVATPIDQLAPVTRCLLAGSVPSVLVEKPLSFGVGDAEDLQALAKARSAEVHVALNRRSYASVRKARELIEKDGGVSSFRFDFTEALFRIDLAAYDEMTVRHWGIANSAHVIDTAFFLGGQPAQIQSRQFGRSLEWHPAGSVFYGMGETVSGVPFAYLSDWGCPGRWNIEVMTTARRLMFSPMEQLHQQRAGSFSIERVELDDAVDTEYKPGFYRQTRDWLSGRGGGLPLSELPDTLAALRKVFGY